MRTERDVRENPVAGDRVRVEWVHFLAVQAAIGGIVAYTQVDRNVVHWATKGAWKDMTTGLGTEVLHIAQPGGDA